MKTLRLDLYLVDTLMPDLTGHDRRPSAFLVYLYLWRRAAERRWRPVEVSLATIAADVGLSKSAVQTALRLLKRRLLVRAAQSTPTAVPEYTVERPWIRRRKATRRRSS